MNRPVLSNRLEHIKNMVPKCDTLYDVGCDHGYLGISLLLDGACERVVFTDIHKEPLEAAKKNAKEYGVESSCEFHLTDGLKGLAPNENDCVCICGMGGPVMESILKAADTKAYLVLEPQSDVIKFHQYLVIKGFEWEKEDMIKEAGSKFYPIDAGRFTGKPGSLLASNAPYPLLKKQNHEVFKEFVAHRQRIVDAILNDTKKLPPEREAELRAELKSLS